MYDAYTECFDDYHAARMIKTLVSMMGIYPHYLRPTNVQFSMGERKKILACNNEPIGEQIAVTAKINGETITKNVMVSETKINYGGYWEPPSLDTIWDIEYLHPGEDRMNEDQLKEAITALFMWEYIKSYLPPKKT